LNASDSTSLGGAEAHEDAASQFAGHRAEISELRECNDQLSDLCLRQSEALRMVAHDLRGPMSNIVGLVDSLRFHSEKSPRDWTPEEAAVVESIRDSACHALTSLKEMLDSERLDSGTHEHLAGRVDFRDVVLDAIERHRMAAVAKSLTIVADVPNTSLEIIGDSLRLGEICDNLISNAVKYSPSGRKIWVSAAALLAPEPRVRMVVRDEGPGMTEEDLKVVFGKFKKLSAKPTAGEGSTGLGLYITKKLVEIHSGTIRVESEPGAGATFLVEFPLGVRLMRSA